jgi:hypothetical protein
MIICGDYVRIRKEAVVIYLKAFPSIRLERLRKITANISQDIRRPGQDLKYVLPDHKIRALHQAARLKNMKRWLRTIKYKLTERMRSWSISMYCSVKFPGSLNKTTKNSIPSTVIRKGGVCPIEVRLAAALTCPVMSPHRPTEVDTHRDNFTLHFHTVL